MKKVHPSIFQQTSYQGSCDVATLSLFSCEFLSQYTVITRNRIVGGIMCRRNSEKSSLLDDNLRTTGLIEMSTSYGNAVAFFANVAYFMTSRHTPRFIIYFSALQVAVFIFYCIQMREISLFSPLPTHSLLILNSDPKFEFWRYFTYSLIHSGPVHLAISIIFQVFISRELAFIFPDKSVAFIFFSGIIVSGVFLSTLHPSSPLFGASGGNYALATACIPFTFINWFQPGFVMFFYREVIMAFSLELFTSTAAHYFNTKPLYQDRRIGSVVGYLLAFFLTPNIFRPRRLFRATPSLLFFAMLLAQPDVTFYTAYTDHILALYILVASYYTICNWINCPPFHFITFCRIIFQSVLLLFKPVKRSASSIHSSPVNNNEPLVN